MVKNCDRGLDIITKQTTTDKGFLLLLFQNQISTLITRKPAFAHFGEHEKSHLTSELPCEQKKLDVFEDHFLK